MKQQQELQRNQQDYKIFALSVAKAEGRPWAVLDSGVVKKTLGLDTLQAGRLFTRLLKQKRIQRLQRGLYMVPSQPPPGKIWVPPPYEALWAYMDWLGAKWQITGYAAFTKHGFSSQIVQRITVYNNILSGESLVGGSRFVFVKLPENLLGFAEKTKLKNKLEVVFSSWSRTLFDAVADAKRFSTLPEAYGWFLALKRKPKELQNLKKICLKLGNNQTTARIGFILESLGIEAGELISQLSGTRTLVPLVPGSESARKGKINKKWGIIENVSIERMLNNVELLDEDE